MFIQNAVPFSITSLVSSPHFVMQISVLQINKRKFNTENLITAMVMEKVSGFRNDVQNYKTSFHSIVSHTFINMKLNL